MFTTKSFFSYSTNFFFFPCVITIWMFPPVCLVTFESINSQSIRSWVSKFVYSFVCLFPYKRKLVFI